MSRRLGQVAQRLSAQLRNARRLGLRGGIHYILERALAGVATRIFELVVGPTVRRNVDDARARDVPTGRVAHSAIGEADGRARCGPLVSLLDGANAIGCLRLGDGRDRHGVQLDARSRIRHPDLDHTNLDATVGRHYRRVADLSGQAIEHYRKVRGRHRIGAVENKAELNFDIIRLGVADTRQHKQRQQANDQKAGDQTHPTHVPSFARNPQHEHILLWILPLSIAPVKGSRHVDRASLRKPSGDHSGDSPRRCRITSAMWHSGA